MNNLLWLILLLLIAAVLRSELFFYLLSVLVGLHLLTRVWLRRSVQHMVWHRRLPPTAFPGESVTVELELHNQGRLPLPWIVFHESLPSVLHTPPMIRGVISLGTGERHTSTYTLCGQQRGYYQIGPLALRTGDVFGLVEHQFGSHVTDALTIYPRILALHDLGLPASLPYGTLAVHTSLFADPARPAGVSPYQPTDGIRRIDWKTSAHSGTILVRRDQPAIARESMLALAFSRDEYDRRYSRDLLERILIVAASLAIDSIRCRQPIGLYTNGRDPLTETSPALIRPAIGDTHLMLLLKTLGRLEPAPQGNLLPQLPQATAHLGWGSTLILLTGQRDLQPLATLLPLKRRGLNTALILIEPTPDELRLPRQHGITTFGVWRDGRPSPG